MNENSTKLTVYFDDPFWAGVFERMEDGTLSVCKVTFGTKSQQALAAQREELKTERKKVNREQKEAEQQRRFEMKQQKRKEKHKGH